MLELGVLRDLKMRDSLFRNLGERRTRKMKQRLLMNQMQNQITFINKMMRRKKLKLPEIRTKRFPLQQRKDLKHLKISKIPKLLLLNQLRRRKRNQKRNQNLFSKELQTQTFSNRTHQTLNNLLKNKRTI